MQPILSDSSDASSVLDMHGPLHFRFTNDYLFRATLQTSSLALKGLVCALMGLSMEDIQECTIENPIELGENIDDKTCILDVKILLNSTERINIELQVLNEGDWTDRSLLYLCRAFDDLSSGSPYTSLKKTVHIGILDFQLFPDVQEFYSEYKMMNEKNGKVYNDKFILRVLELTQIENVSEEMRHTDLYHWARLFKASNWEEVSALAKENVVFKETANTIKKLTAEEKIKLQCEARERYEHDRASAIAYGQRLGMEEGLAQGFEQKLISLICKKLAKGKTPDEIADEIAGVLEESTEHIERICAVAKKFAPEYETDKIFEALKKERDYEKETMKKSL